MYLTAFNAYEYGSHNSPIYPAIVPQVAERPSARLLCTNLPNEVTDSVLSVLFQQCVPNVSLHEPSAFTPPRTQISRIPVDPRRTVPDV